MTLIDLRTVFLVYVLTNALCASVIASLWLQNRKRSPEISLWLINFILQFIAVLLIFLRGVLPDFFSIIIANTFIVGGTVILYIGLERYVGKKSSPIHNYIMVGVFLFIHSYFTYVYNDLALRNINFSLALLYIYSQGSWLMLRGVEQKMRQATRAAGIVFTVICLMSLIRITVNFVLEGQISELFKSDLYNAIILLIYLILFIALTFALFTLVNRRLSDDLENKIDERKQAETILQESEEKFQTLATSALDAIIMMESDGNISFWNKASEKIFGYARQEVLGQNLHALLAPPRYHKGLLGHLAKFRQTGKGAAIGKTLELHGLRKDGTEFPLDLSLSAVNLRGQWVAVGIIRDVTERKQSEETLMRNEEKYRNILDNILEGYFETNLRGDIVFANNSACKMIGYDKDALYKINYRQFSTADTKKKFQEIYGEVYRTGIPSKMSDYEIIRGDGAVRINELSVALIRDSAGNPTGFRAVARDITEKKQAEELIRLRLSLLEFATTHSLEELLQKTLDEVEPLVNSPIGFYHFVEEDQKTLSLQAWSMRTVKEFCKAEGKGMHYGIDQAGVWVDCVHERRPVIHNDYNSLPHRKGLPEGHAAVIRELVVPIMRKGNIVAILGVGNKPVDYTDDDIKVVSYLADVAWEITERKRTEEERNKYANELKERMKEINCLYAISEIVRRSDLSQEEILKKCPDIIVQAYRFPEITACRIAWGKYEFKTDNFRKTEWSQRFDIMVHGKQAGFIEVYCLGGKDQECYDDFFLAEERDLLKNIAELLGRSAERKQAEEELSTERQRLSYILKGTNVGTWEWNVQTGETVFNARWAEIIGYTLDELAPISIDTWQKFVHPDDSKVSGELLEKHFNKELPYYECEARMRHKNGSWVWVLDRGKVATWTKEGKPLIMSGTHQDITDRKMAEEEIIHMATHDSLTNLPTLKLAEDRLAMAMGLAGRHKKKTAVMFLDLDGFKKVNDTLGHDAGDFLLKTLAQRFLTNIRKTDTIARVGGDEFLLIATELNSEADASNIAQKVLKQASQPFTIEGQKAKVSASIGIALYPDHGEDINELIKIADEAMYRIKNSTKNGFCFAKKMNN